MFDEPEENEGEHQPDLAADSLQRAKEKCDEFRMHAELVAVFEGHRKFDAQIAIGLDREVARDIQKRIALLEKSKSADSPVLPPQAGADAVELLTLYQPRDLSLNDYHIHRRPGELMIVRWLADDQVEAFYERMQAHFDAALNQYREEERHAKEWKQDEQTLKYLEALDALEIKMTDRYLRPIIQQHKVFVLSTQTADEMDILYLCDYVIGIESAEIIGAASAPPEQATERDRAWFFKLFSLR